MCAPSMYIARPDIIASNSIQVHPKAMPTFKDPRRTSYNDRTTIATPTTPTTAVDETARKPAPLLRVAAPSVASGSDAPPAVVSVLPLPPVALLPLPLVIPVGMMLSNVTEARSVADEPEAPVAVAPEGRVRVRGVMETPACWHDDWYSAREEGRVSQSREEERGKRQTVQAVLALSQESGVGVETERALEALVETSVGRFAAEAADGRTRLRIQLSVREHLLSNDLKLTLSADTTAEQSDWHCTSAPQMSVFMSECKHGRDAPEQGCPKGQKRSSACSKDRRGRSGV